ncbi:MAG: hypothetical protein FWF24_07850 [Alphaproteobacteria bacterium]|nr:hypothetical protein [Alphaproteobacteria bacterium]
MANGTKLTTQQLLERVEAGLQLQNAMFHIALAQISATIPPRKTPEEIEAASKERKERLASSAHRAIEEYKAKKAQGLTAEPR